MREERILSVSIPAGIEDGQALSLTGEGEAGEGGVKPGDLFVVVHVRGEEGFARRGDDIISVIKVLYPQLVLGDKVNVATLDGSISMKIPAGTEPGEVFRIKSGGIPRLSGFGKGDHLVKVELLIPKKPSSEMKKLLEELQKLS